MIPGAFIMVMVCLLHPLAAGETVTIRLHPTVAIPATQARLDDLAVLEGPGASRCAATPLVMVPITGQRRLGSAEVTAILARTVPEVAPAVSGEVLITRAMQAWTDAELVAAVEAHIRQRLESAEYRLEVVRISGSLAVPADRDRPADLSAEPLAHRLWDEVPYRVRALRGADELGRVLVILRLRVFREVPVLTRDLPLGSVLAQTDVVMQRRELGQLSGAEKMDLPATLGRALRLTLAAGTILTPLNTRLPPMVQGGSSVTLTFKGESFQMSVIGEATGDGALGEAIRVRQPNGRLVRAVVTGPGMAEMRGE